MSVDFIPSFPYSSIGAGPFSTAATGAAALLALALPRFFDLRSALRIVCTSAGVGGCSVNSSRTPSKNGSCSAYVAQSVFMKKCVRSAQARVLVSVWKKGGAGFAAYLFGAYALGRIVVQ